MCNVIIVSWLNWPIKISLQIQFFDIDKTENSIRFQTKYVSYAAARHEQLFATCCPAAILFFPERVPTARLLEQFLHLFLHISLLKKRKIGIK